MVKRLKSSLGNVQSRLATMYAEYGKDVTLSEMNKYDRLAKIEASILKELKEMGVDTRKLTESVIKNNFSEAYYGSGFAYESSLRAGLTFTQLPSEVIRAAVLNPYDKIGWVVRDKTNVATLNRQLREALTEGLIQGYGYKKTVQKFGEKFESYTSNVKRIVATETHRAATMGRNLAFDRAKKGADNLGIKLDHIWDAALDGKTRPDHGALDGQPADENGEWTFPLGGQTTKGPGLSGSASQDINCRCAERGEVDGNTPQTRIDNITKEKIKYQTYDEWAKNKNVPYNKYRDKFNGNMKAGVKPDNFIPAKTVKEAEEWLRKNGVVDMDISKMDISHIEHIQRAVDSLPPRFKNNIKVGDFQYAQRMADKRFKAWQNEKCYGVIVTEKGSSGDKIIGINTKKFKTPKAMLSAKNEAEKRYLERTGNNLWINHYEGCSVYHEFGHFIHNKIGYELQKEWSTTGGWWAKFKKADYLKARSEFGPDWGEAFAEAWAAFVGGDKGELSKDVLAFMEKVSKLSDIGLGKRDFGAELARIKQNGWN